jgi:hypothetical protein
MQESVKVKHLFHVKNVLVFANLLIFMRYFLNKYWMHQDSKCDFLINIFNKMQEVKK